LVTNSCSVVVAHDMPNLAAAPIANPAAIAALRELILSDSTPLNMRTT
jgi:hypothetical protein